MHPQSTKDFKLNRKAILLGVISAAYPMTGYCVIAGRADFVIGKVEAVSPDGSRRVLIKGSEINSGDSINTSEGARAQVRFIDGGYVSLQPNTVFRVDQFNYQNKTDGEEKGFFSLLKGGLRAITGAIGHVHREAYQVATPNATIGIRGTGYKAELRDGGLFVSVGEGVISLTNNVGLLVVSAGNAAYVANPHSAPEPSKEHPQTPPAPLQPVTQSSSTSPVIVPNLPSLATGPGYAVTYAYMYSSISAPESTVQPTTYSPVNATFSPASQLIKYSDGTNSGALGSATVTFSATDGIIGWGRWDGTPDPNSSLPAPSGTGQTVFHYVVGIPTPVMPTTGTATYNLMGYTNPTSTDNSSGYAISGSLTANFSSSTVAVNMAIANATNSYSINDTTSTTISGSNFSGTWLATTSSTGSCGGACGCVTSVSGFFAGTNAERAGMSYQLNNGTANIQGVAAFAKQ